MHFGAKRSGKNKFQFLQLKNNEIAKMKNYIE